MNVIVLVFCFVSYLNLVNTERNEDKVNKLLRLIYEARRRITRPNNKHLNINELPEASGLLPGHSLIKPTKTMLKSAVSFPQEDQNLVYGNLDNLGITYGKTPLRVTYTGFRKGNNVLKTLLKAAREQGLNINVDNPSVVIFQQKKQKAGPKLNKVFSSDKPLTIKELLKSIKIPAKHVGELSKNRTSTKMQKKTKKKTEKQLDRPGQIILNLKPGAETLDERTKRIQDILNGRVTVSDTKYIKEDTSNERASKVKEFINNLVKASEKLPLDKKTKYIEDFLNNKVQVNANINTLNYKDSMAQNAVNEMENNANEILDNYSSEESAHGQTNTRRSKKKKKKYRERDSKYESSESDPSDLSKSSDYERNPGNPFTIHRNKYKQNWLWNHFMDGDHMNVNPFGPPFANMGPSGVDLFFGRKWWYYNQDDYKPLG